MIQLVILMVLLSPAAQSSMDFVACNDLFGVCFCRPTSGDYLFTDCSRRRLDAVPRFIPSNTLYLKLSDNSITSLDNTYLDLPNLKQLEIKNNKLVAIRRDDLIKLPKLEKLDLSGNTIISIDGEAFRMNTNLREIKLTANPLYCGCTMYQFKVWTEQNGVNVKDGYCANKFKNLADMVNNDFGNCQTEGKASTAAAPTAPKVCHTGWRRQSDSGPYLQYVSGSLTDFAGAQQACRTLGGELASIHRWFDYQFIKDWMKGCHERPWDDDLSKWTWLGATDPENDIGKVTWVDGSPLDYHPVLAGEVILDDANGVKETCVALGYPSATGWGWLDMPCSAKMNYVCKRVEKKCPQSSSSTLKGNYTWPETTVGQVATVQCQQQVQTQAGGRSRPAFATRKCSLRGSQEVFWESPDLSSCGYTSKVTQDLQRLANESITQANVVQVTDDLAEISDGVGNFSYVDVALTADTIDHVIKSNTAFTSISSQERTARSLTKTISNMMDANMETLASAEQIEGNAVTKLVEQVEAISKSLGVFDVASRSYVQPNLALAVVDPEEATGDISILLQHLKADEVLTANKVSIQSGTTIVEGEADTFLTIPQEVVSQHAGDKASFALHGKDTLFKVIDTKPGTDPVSTTNSRVVAANLGDSVIKNLTNPIVMHFDYLNKRGYTNPRCVYWDSVVADWSTKGCRVVKAHGDGVSCECDHLTSFALLMDLTGDVGELDEAQLLIQSILTYLGCSMSLIALLFTVFTYFFFKTELLRDNPSRILMNLCLSIIATNLIFISGSHYRIDDAGCKVIAVLLHYTILSSFCWMSVEAFYMYLALIKVFQPYWSKLILKLAIFGWGFPIIPIAITLGINLDNYGLQGLCWLRPIPLLAAFVAPACLMLLFNFVVFGMVMWKLFNMNKKSILTKTDKKSTSTQLRGAASVVVLLGLTWTFGLLNIEGAAVAFSYLFILFNTLQGLFIFLFYCMWKKQARHAWAKKCGCHLSGKDKYRSTNGMGKDSSSGTGTASTGMSKDKKVKGKKDVSDASFSSVTTTTLTTDSMGSRNEFLVVNHRNEKEEVVLKNASDRKTTPPSNPDVFTKC